MKLNLEMYMKGLGRRTEGMGLESKCMKMEPFMRDNSQWDGKKEKE